MGNARLQRQRVEHGFGRVLFSFYITAHNIAPVCTAKRCVGFVECRARAHVRENWIRNVRERSAPRYMVYSCAKSSTERGEREARKVRRCRLYTVSIPGLTVPRFPRPGYILRNRRGNNAKVYSLIHSRGKVRRNRPVRAAEKHLYFLEIWEKYIKSKQYFLHQYPLIVNA